MSDKTLKVVAIITAKDDKIDYTRKVLETLLGPTREEPGCISFDLHHNNDNPKEFVIIEEWKSQQEFDLHFETDHVKAAMAEVPGNLENEPDIRRYTFLG